MACLLWMRFVGRYIALWSCVRAYGVHHTEALSILPLNAKVSYLLPHSFSSQPLPVIICSPCVANLPPYLRHKLSVSELGLIIAKSIPTLFTFHRFPLMRMHL
ncbi:hypothetical protein DAEQUDRAFT_731225 [Daedalea quercina L-15889]|uniref:Secreted protein n=1 Tax=Daedalea quercina L-15889 TaxID=1314783 RepID=A0A165MGN2_9APHY|nr:hypothetical protein DAEQUDRAFT_731225 [Daedalea quercina L-15889]